MIHYICTLTTHYVYGFVTEVISLRLYEDVITISVSYFNQTDRSYTVPIKYINMFPSKELVFL